MKVAVIGSRNLTVSNLEDYMPREVTEIVSGGAKGIDACARVFAQERGIPLREFLPDYEKYGRAAPLRRNQQIIEYADMVLAFWDGASRGTQHVIKFCKRQNVPCCVIHPDKK